MSSSINLERWRIREWIATHRLGGRGGTVLGFHGNCSSPVELFARGLPDKLLVGLGMEVEAANVGTLRVRCRKCEPCMISRARMWAARARDEIAFSGRTWFGTLTLTPARAMQAQFAAERKLLTGGWQLDEVGKPELFRATCGEVVPELQRWLKRIRKNSGARLRYIIIAEAHKSGLPHWHLLLHENSGSVRKRTLEGAWRHGLSHFRLVDNSDTKTPYYVTKYLTKSVTMPRMLASTDYGRTPVRTIAERLDLALANLPHKPEGEEKPLIQRSDPQKEG